MLPNDRVAMLEAKRLGEMHTILSEQYGCPCVVAFPRDTADKIIAHCRFMGATRRDDGEECFVVALRHDVGPELWTEVALRGSCGT